MINKINHIAIIVNDIEKALIPYEKGLGIVPSEIEYVEAYNVRVVFIPVGDTQIELVQPLGDEGDLVTFLKTTGGGLHHIALEVDDVEETIEQMDTSGVKMKDHHPKTGANHSLVAFAKPESFEGVTIEFVQPSKK